MKGEYRRWRCDRCGHAILTALEAEPDGWWLEMQIETLSKHPSSRHPRTVHLCNDCSSAIDAWLRNSPPRVIVHEARWQELEEATRPHSPFDLTGTAFEGMDIEPDWSLVRCIVGEERADELKAQHEAATAWRSDAS